MLVLEACLLDGNGSLVVTSCVDDLDCPTGHLCDRGTCRLLDGGRDAGPSDAGPRDSGPRDASFDAAADAMPDDAGPTDGGAPGPLFSFEDGIFSRPSPATYFDPETHALIRYDVDEPRLLADGSIYLEGSRTNLVVGSETLEDRTVQASLVTANAVVAPDGAMTAELWETEDAPGSRLFILAPPWGGSTRPRAALSLFAMALAGPQTFRQYWRTGGADQYGPDRNVGGEWQRFSESRVDMERHGVAQATEVAVRQFGLWGFQAEAGAFASQYIPTEAAQAVRAAEELTFAAAPAHMRQRRWTVSVAPEASSLAFANGAEPWTLFEFGSPMDAVVIDNEAAAARICVRASGSLHVCSAELVFDADQSLSITVDPTLGRLTVEGAVDGNGSTDAAPWTFPSGPMRVGSGSEGVGAFFGRIGVPVGS